MSDVLTPSLASWRDAHGFGILCIQSPLGERFMIVPSAGSASSLRDISPWVGMTEHEFRVRLLQLTALPAADIEGAVALARRWATTIEGSGKVFWPPAA